jgi:pimeloyl-ACP methyl ester carboxylesterase
MEGMRAARKLLESVIVLAALAAAVVVYCRPVSVVFFKGVMPLRLWHEGGKSQWVTVAGMHIHYDVLGPVNGPPVVLVHGLGGRAEEWLDLAPALTQAGYRVYLPDLPGYGQSDKPADFSYSVSDEAEVVAGFLDAVGLKQVELGGISMGGAIVQHVAVKHPERVERLMLFDAAGIDEQPDWDTKLFTPETVFEVRELNALLYPNPRQVPEFVAHDIVRLTNQNGWVIRRALASMLTGKDATDALLPELKMPVLIVWGAEDKILPLHQGDKIHSLVPQSEFEVFPGCGHLTPYQCADSVSPYVVKFLKE